MVLVQELLEFGLVGAALEDLAADIVKKVEILFGYLYLHAPSKISEVGSVDKVADKEEHSGGDEQVEEVEALEYSVEHKRRGARLVWVVCLLNHNNIVVIQNSRDV